MLEMHLKHTHTHTHNTQTLKIHTHSKHTHTHALETGGMAPVDASHKVMVLKCLESHAQDGQLLVDLFVNYDCDLEGANLFERMVTALVRIAQGRWVIGVLGECASCAI